MDLLPDLSETRISNDRIEKQRVLDNVVREINRLKAGAENIKASEIAEQKRKDDYITKFIK